jgi:hypothetical protein
VLKLGTFPSIIILALSVAAVSGCERHTKLIIEGGNPPKFAMAGSGSLGTIRIRGPEKQRDAAGEDMYLYWVIVNKEGEDRPVRELGAITYGQIPDCYRQVYPESGQAPPLIEGERYNIRVATFDANGADKYFIIRNGKVEVSD